MWNEDDNVLDETMLRACPFMQEYRITILPNSWAWDYNKVNGPENPPNPPLTANTTVEYPVY